MRFCPKSALLGEGFSGDMIKLPLEAFLAGVYTTFTELRTKVTLVAPFFLDTVEPDYGGCSREGIVSARDRAVSAQGPKGVEVRT